MVGLITAITQLTDVFEGLLTFIDDNMIPFFKNLGSSVLEAINDGWEGFISFWANLPDNMVEWITDAWDDFVAFWTGLPDLIGKWIADNWGSFWDKIGEVVGL